MKPFAFRLEKVLGLRAHREKEAQQRLARACRRCRADEQALRAIERRCSEAALNFKIEVRQGTTMGRYRLHRRHLDRLVTDRQTAGLALQHAQAEVEAHRADLLKAAIGRKTLERLKEVQQRRHTEALAREEQKQLDEALIVRRAVAP